MANKKYEETDIQAIADTIREKTGSEDSFKVRDMASGVNEVYEAGKKAEYNEFWDAHNMNGHYTFAGTGWNKNNFKPNKDIFVNGYCFYYHNWLGTPYNLAEHLENLGIKMCINQGAIQQGFRLVWVTRLPVLDFSAGVGYWDRTFQGANGTPLVTIDKIILPPEGTITGFNGVFDNCTALKNITFEGVLDKSISFSSSGALSDESVDNIIDHLADLTGKTSQKITWHSTISGKLTDEQIAKIFDKNWTLY